MSRRGIDLVGKRFGEWTAVERDSRNPNGAWKCKCSCGSERIIRTGNLVRGLSKSCGCQKGARISKSKMTHGESKTKLYWVWSSIKQRCSGNHPDYAGRGITMNSRWMESYEEFKNDVGPPPAENMTLERIDTNGNYEPENVKWATWKEQARNRRNTSKITVDGVEKPLAQWAEETGIPIGTLRARIKRYHLDPKDAVNPKSRRGYASKATDITGKKFGSWTVLEKSDVRWKCQCSCGTVRVIQGSHLKNGRSKSCGCQQSKNQKATKNK